MTTDDFDPRAPAEPGCSAPNPTEPVAMVRPRPRRSVTGPILRISVAMALAIVMLLSTFVLWKQASEMAGEAEHLRRRAATCGSSIGPTRAPLPSEVDPRAETQTLLKGMRLAPAPVRVVDPDGAARFLRLDDRVLVPRRRVTLINLWASWCKPCLAELPRIRDLFEAHRTEWGDDLGFLPILTEDPVAPETLLVKHRKDMPTFRSFAADLPGFIEKLTTKGLYRGSLPVSMLVGCDRKVRWIRFGELNATEMAQMSSMISTLVREIRDDRCGGGDAPSAARLPKPRDDHSLPACGDKRCGEGENALNCPSDCYCGNRTCDGTEDARNCPPDCPLACPRCAPGLTCYHGTCINAEMGY